ncbi:FAD-binding protein [Escherichia albertii]|uniref:FAD-dependent oxidoreductase n=1 Tax=Escherichia albertii TaxID=208962 RepID=UPI000F624724|nr:FAD-binding protein [Escherichia albertii]EFZ2302741.1 FAD-binding protein [Shigella boydii]EFG1227735.1 FAD-binding protein [Escherichia albertii]EFZ6209778.1 FAD-binding protein [Shigella boydii]EFZ6296791.1 FAD-binding protein [Shigella boydii]EFZ6323678.1 FAD-binding protein [Shigella boydii]
MTHNVSESIIDSLTDVKMPHYAPLAQASGSIDLNGTILPEYRCNTLVLGSGAAGWRAAVELKRQNVDVMIASSKAFWGTSACSGSDKQTLHTANTRANGDHFLTLSNTLAAGGAMDHDTAYVEAVGSVNTCEVLKYLGLDLPEDLFGATLRYQTDHDEFGRATSCGPRTSRLMVKVLAQEAMRLNIPLSDHTTAIHILTSGEGENRRVVGVIAIDKSCRDNPWRMVVIRCQHLVLATGGPGELYRDSVYPVNCFSALGMALEAGITLVNLTESQFGIGTPRSQFPWNLSGTYMQAMPRIYSQDHSGRQYNFLAAYYPTTRMLASALCEDIRREGIQSDENSLAQSFQWRQSAQLALAVLRSLQCYIENGGGSRGARAVYDGEAGIAPQTPDGPLLTWRFRPENQDARQYMICICQDVKDYQTWTRPCRERGVLTLTHFEHQWQNWIAATLFQY